MSRRLSHLVAIDDAPFARDHRGNVPIVGAVFAGLRLDGVLVSRVRRDGANATRALVEMISGCRFRQHLQGVLLQGIALAGFNVVDIHELNERLGLPILVVARHQPDLEAVRRALLNRVAGGRRKWGLIQRAGPMEPLESLHVQRAGMTRAEARAVIERLTVHGNLPEPIRVAHIFAGALVTGESRGRA